MADTSHAHAIADEQRIHEIAEYRYCQLVSQSAAARSEFGYGRRQRCPYLNKSQTIWFGRAQEAHNARHHDQQNNVDDKPAKSVTSYDYSCTCMDSVTLQLVRCEQGKDYVTVQHHTAPHNVEMLVPLRSTATDGGMSPCKFAVGSGQLVPPWKHECEQKDTQSYT
jgi:hypothetical protein